MSMRKIYRKIARENGVSVKEVKEDMQAASRRLTRGRCRGKGKSLHRMN